MRYAGLLLVFAAVSFVALIVAAFGFITLFADTDVIREPDAGTALGPLMVVAATLVLVGLLFSGVRRSGGVLLRMPVLRPALISLAAGAVYVLAGALLYGIAAGSPVRVLIFAGSHTLDGYTLAVVLSAAVVAFSYFGTVAWRSQS